MVLVSSHLCILTFFHASREKIGKDKIYTSWTNFEGFKEPQWPIPRGENMNSPNQGHSPFKIGCEPLLHRQITGKEGQDQENTKHGNHTP